MKEMNFHVGDDDVRIRNAGLIFLRITIEGIVTSKNMTLDDACLRLSPPTHQK